MDDAKQIAAGLSNDCRALLKSDSARVKSYCNTSDMLEDLGLQDGIGQHTELGLAVLSLIRPECHVCGSRIVTHKVFETNQYRCEECEFALSR